MIWVKYSHFLTPTADRKKKLLITQDVLKTVLKSYALLPKLLLILMSLSGSLTFSTFMYGLYNNTSNSSEEVHHIIRTQSLSVGWVMLCYTQPTLLTGKDIRHLQSLYGRTGVV